MSFGYTFIWVDDVTRAVEFYEQAFGLTRRTLRENGPMGLYAELETGATTFAIADTKEAHHLFPGGFRPNAPDDLPGAYQISFVVPDAAVAYAAALAAGATGLQEAQTMPWGLAIARIRDPNGVVVSIVSRVP